jgi:hypothetical protein
MSGDPPSLLAREFHDCLTRFRELLSSPQVDLDQVQDSVLKLDSLSKEAMQC